MFIENFQIEILAQKISFLSPFHRKFFDLEHQTIDYQLKVEYTVTLIKKAEHGNSLILMKFVINFMTIISSHVFLWMTFKRKNNHSNELSVYKIVQSEVFNNMDFMLKVRDSKCPLTAILFFTN